MVGYSHWITYSVGLTLTRARALTLKGTYTLLIIAAISYSLCYNFSL